MRGKGGGRELVGVFGSVLLRSQSVLPVLRPAMTVSHGRNYDEIAPDEIDDAVIAANAALTPRTPPTQEYSALHPPVAGDPLTNLLVPRRIILRRSLGFDTAQYPVGKRQALIRRQLNRLRDDRLNRSIHGPYDMPPHPQ